MKLCIASSNVHKIREFREMFKPLKQIDLYSLLDFPKYSLPEETGSTFEENAILKASHAAQKLQMWVLADDSGLVVPALQGAPGVHSRRYAGEEACDRENREKLLKEMSGFDDLQRSAYFECVLAVAHPSGFTKWVHGRVEGTIVKEERGRSGFGYDPLFQKYDYDKTFAELDDVTKTRVSHRRKAFDKLSLILETLPPDLK